MPRFVQLMFVWIAVWLFWIWFAGRHHPTLLLNMLASGVLVAASAIAVHWGRPPRAGKQLYSWIQIYSHLAVRIFALAVVAVLIIQFAYDQLWGPDPARYSFVVNLLMDATFIAIHYGLARLCR